MTREQQIQAANERLSRYWERKEKGPTNADRIRAMTDEELAVLCEDGCPPGQVCPIDADEGLKKDCVDHWLDWLKSPVEVMPDDR